MTGPYPYAPRPLRERVFESLNNAGDNGYDFRGCDPDNIVMDLQTYDADAERLTARVLRPHVVAWLAEHPAEAEGGS